MYIGPVAIQASDWSQSFLCYFDTFKPMPGEMRIVLQEFQPLLVKSGGREFEGGGQMVGRIVERYYNMMNESQSVWGSRLRHLP